MLKMLFCCSGLIAITALAAPALNADEASGGQAKKEDPKDAKKKEASLPPDSLYALATKTLEGKEASLKDYAGKVTLVVNVASQCGYTPQYAGLEKLHGEFKDKGFVVLGFPSNDFGKQEPGTPEEIRTFCSSKFKVTFPLFEKVVTKAGEGQSPIYANLKKQTGELPGWNFCKYLVDKHGKVLKFYKSAVKPDDADLRKDIAAAMK